MGCCGSCGKGRKSGGLVLGLAVALALAAMVIPLVGCQTVRGAGEDLKRASEKTERVLTGEN